MSETINIAITVFTTVLALVNIFQWFDRRSKNKALQNFLGSLYEMAQRLEFLNGNKEVQQKSEDLCSVIKAAIATVGGRVEYNKKMEEDEMNEQRKNKKLIRK